MRVIGVTGPIAAGKSSVCAVLEADGAAVLSADAIAKELYARADVRRSVVDLIGPDAYRPDGSPSLYVIGRRVFADADVRVRINDLLHPLVDEELKNRVMELRVIGATPLVCVEAALLIRTAFLDEVDALVCVVAPQAMRLARLESTGLSFSAALARVSAEIPMREFIETADVVLENIGSRETLVNSVRTTIAALGIGVS